MEKDLIVEVKKCSTCGMNKSLHSFYTLKLINNKVSYEPECKQCRRIRRKKCYFDNIDREKAYIKKYQIKNKAYLKQYYINNRDRFITRYNNYRKNDREKILERERKSSKKRRLTSKGKLYSNFSNNIRRAIKDNKNGRHWETLVNYTLKELKIHLKTLFKPGMSWNNYGKWHIDHKIPIVVFNFTKPEHEDFKRCFALSNLQPLWAHENISKGAQIDKHFQPSLALEYE